MKFKEYLTELFEPAKVTLDHPSQKGEDYLTLPFEIEGHKFQMEFYSDRNAPGNDWQASFGAGQGDYLDSDDRKRRYGMQNFSTNIQYKILSMVAGYILKFLEEYQPDVLIFTAHKQSSTSKIPNARSRIYSKMLDRSTDDLWDLGYKVTVDDKDPIETLFTIERRDGRKRTR